MNDTSYEKIKARLDHDGQVLRILLASPRGNVLDGQMMGEIRRCLDEHGRAPALKAIVFEGEGKHFSFGASVPEHQKEHAPAMIGSFHGMFKALSELSVPTISLVRGQCLGGGMELATFCNFVVAAPGAMFGQPEMKLGVFPPVAAVILPAIVGQSRADDLILTGRSIDADTALQWGLVHAVADDPEAAVEDLITNHLLPKSASSLRLANRASRREWHEHLASHLDRMERLYLDELMETEDANEGIRSFIDKRSPSWSNR